MFKYITNINPLRTRESRIFPTNNILINNPERSPSPMPNPDNDDDETDKLGTHDEQLYDIVKDIKNHITLTKEQIQYLKSISRNNLIKLLNFCNVIFNQQLNDIIYDENNQQQPIDTKQKTLDERQLVQDRRQLAQDRRQQNQDDCQLIQDQHHETQDRYHTIRDNRQLLQDQRQKCRIFINNLRMNVK